MKGSDESLEINREKSVCGFGPEGEVVVKDYRSLRPITERPTSQ